MTTSTPFTAPLPSFASLRIQAAGRFLAIVGAPFLAWALSRIDGSVPDMGTPLKALAYKVMEFEMWLSAPQVSAPLLAGFVVLWLAVTTQSVLSLAELHATPYPDGRVVERGLAAYRRNRIVQDSLDYVLVGSVALALLSWGAKWVHGVDSNEALTLGLAFAMLAMGLVAVSPVVNIVLPNALRRPWKTEEGRLRAGAALRFFGESSWADTDYPASWPLSQYCQVLLYDLARRANALDRVRQALALAPEDDNG